MTIKENNGCRYSTTPPFLSDKYSQEKNTPRQLHFLFTDDSSFSFLLSMISLSRYLHGFRRVMSTTNAIKIGTHNGHFHCDEIFACFLLKLLPRYANAEIVRFVEINEFSFLLFLLLRTRDPKILDQCDTVVDVGAIFNAEQRRFDHHQK